MTIVALVATVALLATTNLLNNRFHPQGYLLTSFAATALLLAALRLSGLGWADAGLSGSARGLRRGLVLVALVAVGYAIGALLPPTRRIFADPRAAGASVAELAYQTLVRIPFATVMLEEVAFRGVLYGLVRSVSGVVWATVVSAVLFGLWHVLPARELARIRPQARRRWLVVPAAVVASALAGVVLCELARRGGSLAVPMAAHWATNALGYLTAFLVMRSCASAQPPRPAALTWRRGRRR
jgi:uncharacterized protein